MIQELVCGVSAETPGVVSVGGRLGFVGGRLEGFSARSFEAAIRAGTEVGSIGAAFCEETGFESRDSAGPARDHQHRLLRKKAVLSEIQGFIARFGKKAQDLPLPGDLGSTYEGRVDPYQVEVQASRVGSGTSLCVDCVEPRRSCRRRSASRRCA